MITAGAGGGSGPVEAEQNGCRVIRVGGSYSVYWKAYRYIVKELADWPEAVIEEVNTIPFFTRLYLKRAPRILVFYMLCREIWFYQLPLPLSLLGYLAEPLYLRLLRHDPAVTISQSTRQDLARHGFDPARVKVTPPGIALAPLPELSAKNKFDRPTVVSMGNIRAMKRTLDQLRAFELARDQMPGLELKIAGQASGRYGRRVLAAIARSRHRQAIEYLGRISDEEKRELLERSHVITVTSIKEGWGLIVTEAASQGTPAAVYDVDGLQDSVRDGETGLVTAANPSALAAGLVRLLGDADLYAKLRGGAWAWSQEITFERGYEGLRAALALEPARGRA
jgi:glycosyltransferase involved in cell wall biosynthesis